jgi:hypothetical protein
MILWLKNIKWFEWLLIGVMITIALASYGIWIKYDKNRDQLAAKKADITVLAQDAVVRDQSATITDNVVTELIQDKQDEKLEQDKSRTGAIDEYLNLAREPERVQKPEAPPPPPPKTTGGKREVKDRPTGSSTDVSRDHDRLSVLANRMHDKYCAATIQTGSGCNPQ